MDFALTRKDAVIVRNLDLHPKKGGLFGNHFLLAKAKDAIPINLSERERRIVAGLSASCVK